MLKDIKNTTKHTSVYAIGNISIKIIGFILLPIYTNEAYLSKDDFGMLAILEATAQLLTVLLSLALSTSLTRWYWDNDYKHKQKSIVFTVLAFLLFLNVPVGLVLVAKATFFSKLIFSAESFAYLLQLTFITVFFRIVNTLTMQLLQIQSKSVYYTVTNVIKLLLVLTLTVVAVTKMGRGLNGIWEASIIGEVFLLLITLPFLLKNISFSFEWTILKEMFHYSYPLVLSNLAVIALTVTDRYMLNYMSGLVATGIYSLGLRLANTLKLVLTDSVMAAVAPVRMQKLNDPDNHRFFSKILTYTSFIGIIFLLLLSLFSLEAIKVITSTTEYWKASGIIGILSFSFLFSMVRVNLTTGLTLTKQSKIMGTLTFVTAALNIALNVALIPTWGMYGAAMATLVSQLLFTILTYFTAQKAYHIPYEIRKIGLAIGLAAIIVFVGIQLEEMHVALRLAIKMSLFIGFPFLLVVVGFYEKVELETLKSILQSWRHPGKLKENLTRLIKS